MISTPFNELDSVLTTRSVFVTAVQEHLRGGGGGGGGGGEVLIIVSFASQPVYMVGRQIVMGLEGEWRRELVNVE